MRIGIIGATGFIGSALARHAVQRGHGVVVFSRRTDWFLPWAKEIRPVAALDFSGLDAVVNLAGESVFGLWTRAKMRRIRESRVDLTNRIVDSLRDCSPRPQVFINASGSGIYGDRGDEILTEESPRGSGFLADLCADWEGAALRAQPLGVRVALLRTGLVLGRDGGAWPLLHKIFRLRLGGRLGAGKQWVPWIHLEDEAGIILQILEKSTYAGPVNLAGPNPATNADLTQGIATLLNKPAFLHAPAFMLRLVLRGLGRVVLDSQRVQPKAAQNRGYEFQYRDLGEALAALIYPEEA